MNKEMFISSSPHETKVAVCEDGQLVEVYFERDTDVGLVGGIYKGRVSRVLPGMQSAFVNIGLERDAFLYVSDFSLQDQEEFEGLLGDSPGRGAAIEIETKPEGEDATAGEQTQPDEAAQPAPSPEDSNTEAPQTATGEAAAEASSEQAGSQNLAGGEESARPSRSADGESGFRHRSHRGRRRRRRGRGDSRDRRPARRAEQETAPEVRESAPTQALEPLPGESLAKYAHSDSEDATASAPSPEAAVETSASEGLAESTPTGTDVSPVSENPETQEQEPAKAKKTSDAAPPPAARSEESVEAPAAAASSDEAAVALAESAEPSEVPSEEKPSDVADEQPKAAESDSEQLSASSEEAPAAAESSEAETEQANAGEESGETSEGSAEPSERSSTVREPHARPRFAPRRSRRGRRRGGRHTRRHGGHESSHSAGTQQTGHGVQISELLKEGQEIIVQIAKEPLGTKGARITSHVALPGRYVVYMPTITHIGVSRKIASERERLRLRNSFWKTGAR